jgi:hypothetical protein
MLTLIAATTLGISGAYFESRTCAIFAGPCHYSGEIMVDGGTAALVWSFEVGSYRGSNIAGLRAAAIVQSNQNLSFDAPRRSVLYIDARATPKQAEAVSALIAEQSGVDLGRTIAEKSATISLSDDAVSIELKSGPAFVAETSTRECLVCSMPGQLWYEPMTRGAMTHVATVERQSLSDAALGETWTRRNEPAAFVGRFNW